VDMDEARFLAEYDAEAFDRPSVTVDLVILTASQYQLWALLLPRDSHPFIGTWAMPGGFVGMNESLDEAARRVLKEKAGLEGVFLEQLYTFGEPGRDPRTRVITVTYYALVDEMRIVDALARKGLDPLVRLQTPWQGEAGGPVEAYEAGRRRELAFDHAQILGVAVKRIRGKLNYAPIGYQLLPSTFTLRQLQAVHETVLGQRLNKDSFRRRMISSGELEATGAWETEVGHRPAELYRFKSLTAI
jgi:8-oxo-dGTP diphosphatase